MSVGEGSIMLSPVVAAGRRRLRRRLRARRHSPPPAPAAAAAAARWAAVGGASGGCPRAAVLWTSAPRPSQVSPLCTGPGRGSLPVLLTHGPPAAAVSGLAAAALPSPCCSCGSLILWLPHPAEDGTRISEHTPFFPPDSPTAYAPIDAVVAWLADALRPTDDGAGERAL